MNKTVERQLNYKRILNERGDYSQDLIIEAKIQNELYWHIDNEILEIRAWNKEFDRTRNNPSEPQKMRTTTITRAIEPEFDEYSWGELEIKESVEITYWE